ncbi:MAG TPA: hypothetical protein VGX21_19905 [Methylomirabilota bacterium]|jgi:hypothetical protein|nr:hypothetical protein [Methylomirabilota bacterium]
MARPGGVWRVFRGIGAAIKARPLVFAAVAVAVLLLDVFLPLLVLSVARKPVDYFTFNPWLRRLPEFLASPSVPLARKLEFVPNLALFWFSADSPYGEPEWGFAVDVTDLARFLLMAALIAAYFALWLYRRDQVAGAGWGTRLRQGGVAGALTGVLGLSTGPCSVMGCGAPVIPVVGLAFVGLSSGTLKLLAGLATVATTVVLGAMTLGVAYLGWLVGAGDPPRPEANRDRRRPP